MLHTFEEIAAIIFFPYQGINILVVSKKNHDSKLLAFSVRPVVVRFRIGTIWSILNDETVSYYRSK